MIEHLIVIFVIVRFIRHLFTIESRGKLGLIPYITKLAIRLSKRIPLVNRKIESYL